VTLALATLEDAIRSIIDRDFDDFDGFPGSDEEVGERWTEAIRVYFAEMVSPPFLPEHHETAAAEMRTAMVGAGVPPVGDAPAPGPTIVPTAITLYASTLAPLASLVGFAATPPPLPAPFVPAGGPSHAVATALATALDAWARTGLQAPLPASPSSPWA